LKTILAHNREQLASSTLTSFGERVNNANDLSAVLVTERTVPRPSGPTEPRDYRAALAGLLKPRRPR